MGAERRSMYLCTAFCASYSPGGYLRTLRICTGLRSSAVSRCVSKHLTTFFAVTSTNFQEAPLVELDAGNRIVCRCRTWLMGLGLSLSLSLSSGTGEEPRDARRGMYRAYR